MHLCASITNYPESLDSLNVVFLIANQQDFDWLPTAEVDPDDAGCGFCPILLSFRTYFLLSYSSPVVLCLMHGTSTLLGISLVPKNCNKKSKY